MNKAAKAKMAFAEAMASVELTLGVFDKEGQELGQLKICVNDTNKGLVTSQGISFHILVRLMREVLRQGPGDP